MEAIVVALIGGPLLAATKHLLEWKQRRDQREVADIVRGNGKGDILHLSESIYMVVGEIKGKLEAHLDDESAHR